MIAEYISANQFRVEEDRTEEFKTGRRIKAYCGVDGYKYSTIFSSSYSSPYTTITIVEDILTSNLEDVLYGIVNIGETGAFPDHLHDGTEGQGGALPHITSTDFSTYSGTLQTQIDNKPDTFLDLTDTPSSYDSGKYAQSTSSGIVWTTAGSSNVQTFLDLTDTPTTYSGHVGKHLKATSSGIEFIQLPAYNMFTAASGLPSNGNPSDYYINLNTGDIYEYALGSSFYDDEKFNIPSMTHAASHTLNGTPEELSDGNAGTYWQDDINSNQWVSIDLGISKNIYKVLLQGMISDRFAKNFRIEGSINNADWDVVYTGITVQNNDAQEFIFPALSTSYRYWRLYIIDIWGIGLLLMTRFELFVGYTSDNYSWQIQGNIHTPPPSSGIWNYGAATLSGTGDIYCHDIYIDDLKISAEDGSFMVERPSAALGDEIVLLLHMDGSDGGSTFLDSATTPKTIQSDNATTSTSHYKFGTSAGYFNGSTSKLSIPDSADWYFGLGAFTIECWVWPSDVTRSYGTIYAQRASTEQCPIIIDFVANRIRVLTAGHWSEAGMMQSNTTLLSSTWYHIAVTRQGDRFYLFINGVLDNYHDSTESLADAACPLLIGGCAGASYYFLGYIDELCVSKGVAKWTSDFTPPTAPYIAIESFSKELAYIDHTHSIKDWFVDAGTASNSLGKVSDLYIDSTDSKIYEKQITGSLTFTAKSIIIDMTNNWTDGSYIGLRSVELYLSSSKVSTPLSTLTGYDTSASFDPIHAFKSEVSKNGSSTITNGWTSDAGVIANQRIVCVFSSPITFDSMVINNYHHVGGATTRGAKDINIYYSTDAITTANYGGAISNSALIFTGQLHQHAASDAADDQALTLINNYSEDWNVVLNTVNSFSGLVDAPSTYSGTGGMFAQSTGSGIVWATVSGIEGSSSNYTPALPDNLSYNGSSFSSTAGEDLLFGDVCYLKNDGKFWKARSNSETTSKGLLSLSTGAINTNSQGTFLQVGYIRNDAWNFTIGSELFIPTISGGPTDVAPSAPGSIIRIVGNAYDTNIVWFCPDQTYIELSATTSSGISFLNLSDVPTTYSGTEGLYAQSTGSGIVWATVSGGGTGSSDVQSFLDLTDTPSSYTGYNGKFIGVVGDTLDFVDGAISDSSALFELDEYGGLMPITGSGISYTQTFLNLTDTPNTYSGTEGLYAQSTGSGIVWATVSGGGTGSSDVQSFTDLTDVPSTYSGTSGMFAQSTGSGIVWTTISGLDGVDGADGVGGVNGVTWITSSGIPSIATGNTGDYYLDLGTYNIYKKNVPTYGVTDLFTGGTPSVSSVFSGSSPATNAVDNDTGTCWFAATATNEWFKYDFGSGNEKSISKIRVHPKADGSTRNFKDYQIHGSNNNTDWSLLHSGTIPAGTPTWENMEFSNPTPYRYIKIIVLNTYNNYCGINEVEAFDASGFDWGLIGNIKGANGTNGTNGTNGLDGSNGNVWLSGTGVPSSSLGSNYDFYFDEANGDIYAKDAPSTTNVLAGGTISSTTPPVTSLSNVLDGNITTFITGGRAGSFYSQADNEIKYDLGAGNEIIVTSERHYTIYGGCELFTIQGSNDNTNWDILYSGGNIDAGWYESGEFTNTTAYRYYRLYCTKAGNYFSLSEWELIGATYVWDLKFNTRGPAGATASGIAFTDLIDTPSTYSDGLYAKSTTSGIVWATVSGGSGASSFIELTDTPSSYSNGKFAQSTASGIVWTTVSGGGTETSYGELELTYASDIVLDFTEYNLQSVILTGNTNFTFTNMTNGKPCILNVIQDAQGSRSATFQSNIRWPQGVIPTTSSGSGLYDIFTFIQSRGTICGSCSAAFQLGS